MSVHRILALLALAVLATASSCATLAVAAATVDGVKITEAEVEEEVDRVRDDPNFRELLGRQGEEFRGEARRNILTHLIRLVLMQQEAERLGVAVTPADVDAYLDDFKREVGGEERFQQLLEESGMTEARVRVLAERQLLRQQLIDEVTRDLEAEEEHIRAVYEQNPRAFEEVRLLRITVPTQEQAEQVLAELAGGRLFSEVARQRSIDEFSDRGGDVGFVPVGELESALMAEIEATPEGGHAGPVPGPQGFEVYQVLDRRTQPLAEVRDEISRQLLEQDRERVFGEWEAERLREVRVVVNPKYGVFDAAQLQIVPERDARES